jgi:hypothetical protein
MKTLIVTLFLFLSQIVQAGPVLQMNHAFQSLMNLMPFVVNDSEYKNPKNEKEIKENLKNLNSAFTLAKHDQLIKHDLFAPSYALISENLKETQVAFEKGKKDYSQWLVKETMSLCMDCHARLPVGVTSSFQNGELTVDTKKIRSPYDIGMAYLIVRRFVDAKANFTRSIQDSLIKKDDKILLPFQQILMIETKIKKDPGTMISIINDYLTKNNLPADLRLELETWKKRLILWKEDKAIVSGINNEGQLKDFIKRRLIPLKDRDSFNDAFKIDLLLASGLISNYFFENQSSPTAPELSFWLGWIEKRLKKEAFLSSGDLFLKQCIRKYSHHPVAKECLREYQESVEFDFSGSSGTQIPPEVEKELKDLRLLLESSKK